MPRAFDRPATPKRQGHTGPVPQPRTAFGQHGGQIAVPGVDTVTISRHVQRNDPRAVPPACSGMQGHAAAGGFEDGDNPYQ